MCCTLLIYKLTRCTYSANFTVKRFEISAESLYSMLQIFEMRVKNCSKTRWFDETQLLTSYNIISICKFIELRVHSRQIRQQLQRKSGELAASICGPISVRRVSRQNEPHGYWSSTESPMRTAGTDVGPTSVHFFH